jgi:hypothetical protein
MIDAIGLSDFLLETAILWGLIFLVLSLFLFKVLLKKSLVSSIWISIIFAIIASISSPFLFYAYIRLMGYSLI